MKLVMYGCESWTVKKAEHWRTDAFELWCWRRLFVSPLDFALFALWRLNYQTELIYQSSLESQKLGSPEGKCIGAPPPPHAKYRMPKWTLFKMISSDHVTLHVWFAVSLRVINRKCFTCVAKLKKRRRNVVCVSHQLFAECWIPQNEEKESWAIWWHVFFPCARV